MSISPRAVAFARTPRLLGAFFCFLHAWRRTSTSLQVSYADLVPVERYSPGNPASATSQDLRAQDLDCCGRFFARLRIVHFCGFVSGPFFWVVYLSFSPVHVFTICDLLLPLKMTIVENFFSIQCIHKFSFSIQCIQKKISLDRVA